MERVIIFSLILVLSFSCVQKHESQDNHISTVSPNVFKSKMLEIPNAVLVDVRTPKECASGMLENAQQINYHDTDFETKIKTLDKSKPVFVYCRLGGRSGKTALLLKEAGFNQIYDLNGGITAWKKQGLKVIQSEK